MGCLAIRILIVDRNPHVREFLHREFLHLGYTVQVGKSCDDITTSLSSDSVPHLIVLDPDLPGQSSFSCLEKIRANRPGIPVIAHLFASEDPGHPALQNVAAVVEKSGRIDELKSVVEGVLGRTYPGLCNGQRCEQE